MDGIWWECLGGAIQLNVLGELGRIKESFFREMELAYIE